MEPRKDCEIETNSRVHSTLTLRGGPVPEESSFAQTAVVVQWNIEKRQSTQ